MKKFVKKYIGDTDKIFIIISIVLGLLTIFYTLMYSNYIFGINIIVYLFMVRELFKRKKQELKEGDGVIRRLATAGNISNLEIIKTLMEKGCIARVIIGKDRMLVELESGMTRLILTKEQEVFIESYSVVGVTVIGADDSMPPITGIEGIEKMFEDNIENKVYNITPIENKIYLLSIKTLLNNQLLKGMDEDE